jgi:hypothetical protein
MFADMNFLNAPSRPLGGDENRDALKGMSLSTHRGFAAMKQFGRSRDQFVPVETDPPRRFAPANYRIAKGLFAAEVEVSIVRDMVCFLSLMPRASFDRWRGRSTAGPFH